MTDPPRKTTWTEESFDDVELTATAASAGNHGTCHVLYLYNFERSWLLHLPAAWLGASSQAFGYLQQKLAQLTKSLDPTVCQVMPTVVLQIYDCLCLYVATVQQGFVVICHIAGRCTKSKSKCDLVTWTISKRRSWKLTTWTILCSMNLHVLGWLRFEE